MTELQTIAQAQKAKARGARATYRSRARDIKELMRLLQNSLKTHLDTGEEINWAHAGDLAHVRSKLAELVSSVAGVCEDTVCEELRMD